MRALDWLMPILPCLCLAAGASAAGPDPAPPTDTAPRLIHEVRIGVMAHDVDGLWSGQHKEKGVDYSGEVVFGHSLGHFGSGVIRPNLGFDLHNRRETSKAYGGLLWHWDSDRRVSFEFGLGAALHSGERQTDDPHRKQLGSRFLFRIPIELGYAVAERQRVSLFFEHCSNAWLAHENEGMDLVGARWAYEF